jgi:hypothetical protein
MGSSKVLTTSLANSYTLIAGELVIVTNIGARTNKGKSIKLPLDTLSKIVPARKVGLHV